MITCVFIKENGSCKCAHCGQLVRLDIDCATVYAECYASVPLFTRIAHFATALVHHVADGCAKRSEAEIEAILETHCKPCDKFDGSHCTVCGCNCTGNVEFLNKLAWRSERCPEGKW